MSKVVSNGVLKMVRLQRFILSGNACLFLACSGAFCYGMIVLGYHVDKIWKLPTQHFIHLFFACLMCIPLSFFGAVTFAIAAICNPPSFRKPRAVYYRVALAAFIYLMTAISSRFEMQAIMAKIDTM